ncbi:IS630 family transposase [Salinibacter sp.]|uniref:IS630 family transposase n=1 Tax=Salinibacter sp. TaxID=2065818 RepID=UPI0021E83BFF|nr:IS630 family transposase [Salinibacter sp.]
MSGLEGESDRSSRESSASSTTSPRSVAFSIRSGGAAKKPDHRSDKRDEEAIEEGKEQKWPLIKKAETNDRTVIYVDEAGFYQLPAAVRTWAPRGQTPVLRAPLNYDNLSAISGITRAGKLYMLVFEQSITGEKVVEFLRHVLREVSGKLTIVWDGLPAHRGQTAKEFLAEGGSRRLHLERLPGYVPDLNPDEAFWNCLKNLEMKNLCCWGIDHLKTEL